MEDRDGEKSLRVNIGKTKIMVSVYAEKIWKGPSCICQTGVSRKIQSSVVVASAGCIRNAVAL